MKKLWMMSGGVIAATLVFTGCAGDRAGMPMGGSPMIVTPHSDQIPPSATLEPVIQTNVLVESSNGLEEVPPAPTGGLKPPANNELNPRLNTVAVGDAPPPPRIEEQAEAPGTDYTWVEGFWAHINDRWVWMPGHWEKTRPGSVWVAGKWEQQGENWQWSPGFWQEQGEEREQRNVGGAESP